MTNNYIKLNRNPCSEEENKIIKLLIDMYVEDIWINKTSEDIDDILHLSVQKINDIAMDTIPYINYTSKFSDMIIHIKKNIPYKEDSL